jgi:predicted AlkP superfamily phosphohydrolase/phosphomutase
VLAVDRKDKDLKAAPRRSRLRFVAAFVVALVAGGCVQEQPAGRVVVLGLDGADWSLLDPLMKRGVLPNLAKLRSDGAWAPLRSIEPSSSPVIWTSIATGKSPEKHGITSFVRFPTGNAGNPQPVASTMRRGKALWNILSKRGYDVAIDGWFVTWPVEAVNGRMISDRAHWGERDERGVFPPNYLAELSAPTLDDAKRALPEFMRFDLDTSRIDRNATDGEQALNFLVFDRFARAYLRDLFYLQAAERMLADGPLPQFFALYLRGTDDVQHGFWKFMQPELFEGVTAEQAERFGKVIERYWQWTDAAVGKILSYYEGTPHLVLVVSDHGAGPAVDGYKVVTKEYLHLSGSHRDIGVLIANGPGVRRGGKVAEATVYDVTPTILRYLGEPLAADMDGKPLDGLFTSAVTGRAIERVATFDEAGDVPHVDTPHAEAHSNVDAKALEHLRSLGYID